MVFSDEDKILIKNLYHLWQPLFCVAGVFLLSEETEGYKTAVYSEVS